MKLGYHYSKMNEDSMCTGGDKIVKAIIEDLVGDRMNKKKAQVSVVQQYDGISYKVEEGYQELYEGEEDITKIEQASHHRRRKLSLLDDYVNLEESTCTIHESFQVSITFLSAEDLTKAKSNLYNGDTSIQNFYNIY